VSTTTGIKPATGGWLGEWLWMALAQGKEPEPPNLLDMNMALASTAAWILIFAAASLALARRARGVAIEEFAES